MNTFMIHANIEFLNFLECSYLRNIVIFGTLSQQQPVEDLSSSNHSNASASNQLLARTLRQPYTMNKIQKGSPPKMERHGRQ